MTEEKKVDKTIDLYQEIDHRVERLERIMIGIVKDIRNLNRVFMTSHTPPMRNIVPLIEEIEKELQGK